VLCCSIFGLGSIVSGGITFFMNNGIRVPVSASPLFVKKTIKNIFKGLQDLKIPLNLKKKKKYLAYRLIIS